MYLLILFIPLLNSFILGFLAFKIKFEHLSKITFINIISLFLLSCFIFYEVALLKSPCYIELGSWITSNILEIKWSFQFDTLTSIMLIVVTSVSMCVHIYSFEYMKEDPHIQRFISYLSLFTFFMLLLVTANNFLQMFFGWEGVGLCSYLLINFWFNRIQANKAAIKAMIINRVGDFGLSLGIFLCFYVFKTLDYSIIFSLNPNLYNKNIIFLNINFDLINMICFFIFIGAVGKSAQIGLHTWLPDAMEGPTPVSALIHAATMVTAGVFLICRCSPLFQYSSEVSSIITILGSITAFVAGTIGLTQNDLKRVIAYSTCSQLGYMIFACGISSYYVSIFHLSNHAFFKAALFLSAGSVIHGLSDEQDMRKMGSSLNFLYYTFITMTIGSLSLKGFPFLTGFYSKDSILELTFVFFSFESLFADFLGDISAFSTAFYSNRALARTFIGENNMLKSVFLNCHDSPFKMAFPLFLLSIGGFYIGYLSKDMFIGVGLNFWNNSLYIRYENSLFFEAEFLEDTIKKIPLFFSFCGSFLAFVIYNNKTKYLNKNLFFIKQNKIIISLYTFLNRKWFFDKIYNEIFSQLILKIAYKYTYQNLDRGIIELLGPNGIGTSLYNITNNIRKINIGILFNYLFSLYFFLFIFINYIIYYNQLNILIDLKLILIFTIYITIKTFYKKG